MQQSHHAVKALCSDLCLVLLLQANAIYLELVNLGFKVEHCEESRAK